MKFDVVETSESGEEVYFRVKDRSKGFFWFFNFVMRLEFNPKTTANHGRTIYLLDEPGSYLHASAQDRLCVKLRDLAKKSYVFYCTHSHHLLSPHTIPFNSIRIVEKLDEGGVAVRSVFDRTAERRVDAAFQPVLEALQVRPSALDASQRNVVVVEGLYDFFAFEMFKPRDTFMVIPAVNAHSIQYHISWLMAWGIDYRALWDNDPEGQKKYEKAKGHFGEDEAKRRFRLLPLPSGSKKKKRRLEDLFADGDLGTIRSACGLPSNSSFTKAILAAFYAENRDAILSSVSNDTHDAFNAVYESLWQD